MTEAPTIPALRMEREFEAPAAAVFEAWTNPEVMKRWFHGDPGWDTPQAESDLRVGGRAGTTMREPDGTEHGWTGEYTEVDEPRRLAFTLTWNSMEEQGVEMLVELDFHEEGGVTTLVLTQTGFPSEESRQNHRSGWDACFDNLENKALAR